MTSAAPVLTLNAGSSSIRFALFEVAPALRRMVEGKIERIALPGTTLTVKGEQADDNFTRPLAAADHGRAAAALMDWLRPRLGGKAPGAVGHRIVHGGPQYSAPQRISTQMIEALHRISPFDPQHLPAELLLVETLQRSHPGVAQVACFDTAFHQRMPRVARMLPIPRRYEAKGLRRYGFHGLSYAYLLQQFEREAGAQAARGRLIFAHLGNGASLAAVHKGQPVDTSMGFTPAAGVPMSTRAGDLDPGVAGYLARTENMSPEQFNDMVNFQSGLLGISETSSDMRDLLEREHHDVRAAEAIALFCYQIRKWIGAFAAALGGLDALIFAGGIGESAPVVRSRICDGLAFLGIELDNKGNGANAAVISRQQGRVGVRVMRTDEEWMIAQTVCDVLNISTHQNR